MESNTEPELHVLCLNVGVVKKTAHKAIIAAFVAAKKKGREPGAILLQEYIWVTVNSLENLRNEMDATCNYPQNERVWEIARQFGNGKTFAKAEKGKNGMDCVVLYNTKIYKGEKLPENLIPTAEAKDIKLEVEEGDPVPYNKSLKHAGNFKGRWAGVLLTTNGSNPKEFALISYHGRDNREGKHNGKILQGSKEHLGPYFVAHVAQKCAALSTEEKRKPREAPVPGLIGGDWNHTNLPSALNRKYNTRNILKNSWQAKKKLPDGNAPARKGKNTDFSHIDYFVSINYTSGTRMTHEINITESKFLPHSAELRNAGRFDHDPVLVSFTLVPKKLSPIVEEAIPEHQPSVIDTPQTTESGVAAPLTPQLGGNMPVGINLGPGPVLRSPSVYNLQEDFISYNKDDKKVSWHIVFYLTTLESI